MLASNYGCECFGAYLLLQAMHEAHFAIFNIRGEKPEWGRAIKNVQTNHEVYD